MATLIFSHANQTTELVRVKQAIVGISKHLGGAATLLLAGQTFTPTSLVALLQAFVDEATAIDTAKASLRDLFLKERDDAKSLRRVLQALRSYVVALYGNDAAAILADFGFTPHKAPAVKPETRVVAAAKNVATRKARHTLGKRQRKGIKGVVETPAVSPPAGKPGGGSAPVA